MLLLYAILHCTPIYTADTFCYCTPFYNVRHFTLLICSVIVCHFTLILSLVKDQCRLEIRKYSFSQGTINEWNKLSTDCVTASSVNMFKNKVDTYLRRAGLDKPMASLSTCHLGIWFGWQILLNLVKFEKDLSRLCSENII